MDTPIKNLTKEEKENVLLVLNEFSEEYKANTKSVTGLITSIREFSGKINRLLEKVESQQPAAGSAEASQVTEAIEIGIEKITASMQAISFPEDKLRQLATKLDKNTLLLQSPIPQKVVHHHYLPKIIWIAAGLFLALALACAGWFVTGNKLDGYIANDTKYRLLKLDTANIALQKKLYHADSLFRNDRSLRDSVMNGEEEFRQNFELLQKATRMNSEAENLKTEAKKLRERAGKRDE